MPFRPYHCFQNRLGIENLIKDFKESGNILDDTYQDFHRYHGALIHKLRSAKYQLDRLKEKLLTTDVQEAADPSSGLRFEVNMFIDGFFYNAGSSLDILARVVLVLFGQTLPRDVYFQTAYQALNRARPGDPILQRLTPSPWRRVFSDYRNALTHELILASRYQIEIDHTGPEQNTRIVFPIPDDPRAKLADRQYRRNPDAVVYGRTHFTRILSLGNTIYGDIITRSRQVGSLPL